MLKFRWETEFKKTEIGEIPKDWEIKKLGDIAEITTGGTPRRNNPLYWNGNINWLKSQEVADNYIYDTEEKITELGQKNSNAKKTYPPGTLIIALYASPTAGRVALLRTFSTINQALAAIVGENNRFLFFSLIGNRERLLLSASGAAQQNLNLQIVKDFEIPLPSLPEQSRIATVLSWFDDLIEVKKKQNEILEKTAMAIFKSWFIDFEPFRACPEQERGNWEFVYNEDLGRDIPKGWEVDKTTRFIQYNPSISIRRGEICPFVEMKDVKSNSLACDFSVKEFNGSGVKYLGGDTLMARITPSLEHGKTAFVWFISEKEKGFGSTEFFVLHPKEPYLKEFVYLLAKNEDFREVAINSMSGTSGRQRADVNALKNYLIPIPPPHILQSFHSLVEPLFQKIILNQKQIMTLRKIRDTLLPLLVFGKLRVEEI